MPNGNNGDAVAEVVMIWRKSDLRQNQAKMLTVKIYPMRCGMGQSCLNGQFACRDAACSVCIFGGQHELP